MLGVINISKENHEIDDENKRIENNNRHIREKNEKVKYWIKEETEALQNEYNKLSRKLEETQDTLLQMYSLDVIFPKYRNIIAVSSFYEYLLSAPSKNRFSKEDEKALSEFVEVLLKNTKWS